jgi:hypothetical protein
MAFHIIAIPNEKKTAFAIPSDHAKSMLLSWFHKYEKFKIEPITEETRKGRKYLEGAVVPSYCKWQYGIDPRDPEKDEARRYLFKRDFNYEIITDRDGKPVRMPKSSRGQANAILERFTEWASENGCPIPNPALFKLYRDKWSMDPRFSSYHDFLDQLDLAEDAMPSTEHIDQKLS